MAMNRGVSFSKKNSAKIFQKSKKFVRKPNFKLCFSHFRLSMKSWIYDENIDTEFPDTLYSIRCCSLNSLVCLVLLFEAIPSNSRYKFLSQHHIFIHILHSTYIKHVSKNSPVMFTISRHIRRKKLSLVPIKNTMLQKIISTQSSICYTIKTGETESSISYIDESQRMH